MAVSSLGSPAASAEQRERMRVEAEELAASMRTAEGCTRASLANLAPLLLHFLSAFSASA